MFEGTFTITVVSIIALSLIIAILRGRIIDRCLKDFRNNKVTAETNDGNVITGILDARNNGIELAYDNQKIDGMLVENSYIIYSNEFSGIYALTRRVDEMSKRQLDARALQLKWSYNPGLFRKLFRGIRNWVNTVRDTIVKSAQSFLGAKGFFTAGTLGQTQSQYTTQLGEEIVGRIAASYDPILEKHIGRRVIVETKRENSKVKHLGILRCYTGEFIELMDVNYNYKIVLRITRGKKECSQDGVSIEIEDHILRMYNSGRSPVAVLKMASAGVVVELNKSLQPGKMVESAFDGNPDDLVVYCETVRLADMIMSRINCVVRNASV